MMRRTPSLTLVMIICVCVCGGGEWDGARIKVEYGDEILAYDTEGDCRFVGVVYRSWL